MVCFNTSFDFLSNPEEDIYSWEDGKKIEQGVVEDRIDILDDEESPKMPPKKEFDVSINVIEITKG
jgi:hypothetical protein